MDKLSDLPPAETQLTPEENQIMEKYFTPDSEGENQSTKKKASLGWMATIKLAGAAALLFLALANPFVDALLSKMPFGCGDNTIATLGVKALLYMILFILLLRYLL